MTTACSPAPPNDPVLPAVATALDGDAMAEELLAAMRPMGIEVTGCSPRYVRYKHGTSCRVLYDLRFRLSHAAQGEPDLLLPVHGWMTGTGTAEAVARRPSFERLLMRTARHHPAAPQPRAVVVPSIGMLIQVYPVDRELPSLARAAATRKAGRLLARAIVSKAEAVPLREVELVRYRPARRAVLRYRPAAARDRSVFVKIQRAGRAAEVRELGVRLARAGVPVPDTLPLLEEVHGLAQFEVPGTPLAALAGDRFVRHLASSGALLAAFHDVPLAAVRRTLPDAVEAQSARVEAAGRAIALLRPTCASAVRRLAEAVAAALSAVERADTLVHGDFYEDQVLISRDGPVLLDLDEARAGDPYADLGNMIGHLAARLPADLAEQAGDSFLGGYDDGRGLDRRLLALFEAAALLEMAVGPFRRLEPDWPDAVDCLTEAAARRFTASTARGRGRGVRVADRAAHTPRPPADPALPTLAALENRSVLEAALSDAIGRRVQVEGIEVVRHKPGRRCTLRFEVSDEAGSWTGRVYGKTWASERGSHVHRTLAALALASLPAGSPTLPRPLAWLPGLRLHLQSEVPGSPIAPSLLDGSGRAAEAMAIALFHLHASDAALGRSHGPSDELATLVRRIAAMRTEAPALGRAASRCLAALGERTLRPFRWRHRPLHRDLYHDQVLYGPHGVSFVDLDDAAMGEPAVDVANVLAHLRLLGLQATGNVDGLAGARDAFARRYRSLDPALDPEVVQLLEAATLIRLTDIHRTRPGGERIAPLLLHAAGHLLGVREETACA